MKNLKATTWEVEGLRYPNPYVIKFNFLLTTKQMDELHYLLEHEFVFKRMGYEFYFETAEVRAKCLNRITQMHNELG